jgi:glucokinase
LVVIGGGVVEAGDLVLNPARAAMEEFMPFRGQHPHPKIVAAQFLNDAGLVGAADLAR